MKNKISKCPICGTVPQVQDAPEFGENEFVICCCGVGMSSVGRKKTISEWNKYIAEYPLKMKEQYIEKKIYYLADQLQEMLIAKNQNRGFIQKPYQHPCDSLRLSVKEWIDKFERSNQ